MYTDLYIASSGGCSSADYRAAIIPTFMAQDEVFHSGKHRILGAAVAGYFAATGFPVVPAHSWILSNRWRDDSGSGLIGGSHRQGC